MRTTLNLSTEALANVRQLAQQRGKTLGEIASALILKAIEPEHAPDVRNGVPLFRANTGLVGGEGAPDIKVVNRLRDEEPCRATVS